LTALYTTDHRARLLEMKFAQFRHIPYAHRRCTRRSPRGLRTKFVKLPCVFHVNRSIRIDCSEVFKIEKSERFPMCAISYYGEIYIDINNDNIK